MVKKNIWIIVINDFFETLHSFGWRSTVNCGNDQKLYTKTVSDEKFLKNAVLFFEEFDFK